MDIKNAFDLYYGEIRKTTYNTHSNKIKEYIVKYISDDIDDFFSESNLKEYIFSGDQTALGKYNALISFYKFIHSKILSTPKKSVVFPISKDEAEIFDAEHGPYDSTRKNNKGDRLFLDRTFSLSELFSEKYYQHMNNDVAAITAKAAIALGIGAGYDSGEMFFNNNSPKMKLYDPIINDEEVKVKNYSTNTDIKYIELKGELANYLREYYSLRLNYNVEEERDKDLFFIKMWSGYQMEIDSNIEKKKPANVQMLIYYVLKYISIANSLDHIITITDLRSNLVLHSLYNSKGAALKQIISVFAYPPFVQEAFAKYRENDNEESCTIMYDPDFFQYSPLENSDEKDSSNGENKKVESIISKIIRDKKIVRDLKEKYNNVCQICGKPLMLIDNISYSEGCHIQPIGGEHRGIDDKENLLILCPNHHKLFDMGFLTIDPDVLNRTIYVDEKNILHNKEIKLLHKISPICVRYHYENIFLPLKRMIINKDVI